MSPEQLCGLEISWRTDVWAFGCVLFELVTGRRAFTGKSRTELVRAILDAEPSWSELPAELPAPVVDLLHQCLAKDAWLRPRMSHIRSVLAEAPAARPGLSSPAEIAPTTLGIDPTSHLAPHPHPLSHPLPAPGRGAPPPSQDAKRAVFLPLSRTGGGDGRGGRGVRGSEPRSPPPVRSCWRSAQVWVSWAWSPSAPARG